ncbi:antibiotic biosynthesis monooxygenase [Streptomyces sp. RerS4]|uniref:antibiotic biosynthesis monooxygenase family protein n=1 Tax=Streptomyces sp. RerS4 TaxID=2942449 RepID=UPI00201C2142|nr:antibiotic biosynthesis monooxygenase [Streptomyces sp. RerS4]UQX02100.1 antibiotic biosynthesis monooxygenase [Streptomyces sp. RerS4]
MTIQPLPAFEPPYVMAVFTNVRTADETGFAETDARLNALVQDNPGMLGYESARTPGGLSITVAYFRDHETLTAWRQDAEHQAAMKHGRAHWYESYTLHVATVERSHGYVRDA